MLFGKEEFDLTPKSKVSGKIITRLDLIFQRSKKMSEPSPYVIVNVGQKTEESKIVNDSTDPRWEQGFRFLVHDPNFQTVDFKVRLLTEKMNHFV